MCRRGIAELSISNRTESRVRWDDLVANSTSVGMNSSDRPVFDIPPGAGRWVADVVMRPGVTALIRQARDAGFRTVDGREMLRAQIRQTSLFLGFES
jgi:shikimate 5-dehydrogenase